MPTLLEPKTPFFADHPSFDSRSAWVLLWSQKQGGLHIETLDAMLMSHAKAFAENRELQYIPMLIGDRAVVDAAAERMRPTVAKRHDEKHAGQDGHIPYEQLP